MLPNIWESDNFILTERMKQKTLMNMDSKILNKYYLTGSKNEGKNHDQVRHIPGIQMINIQILINRIYHII